jgi:hypothetical protein
MAAPESQRTVRFVPAQHEPEMDMFAEGAACALAENHETRAIYHQVLEVVVEEVNANGGVVTAELDVYVQEAPMPPEREPMLARRERRQKEAGAGRKKKQ